MISSTYVTLVQGGPRNRVWRQGLTVAHTAHRDFHTGGQKGPRSPEFGVSEGGTGGAILGGMTRKTSLDHPLAPPPHLGEFSEFEEHGQLWLECCACGAQWSVVETSRGADLEEVTEGDGYCEENHEEEEDY